MQQILAPPPLPPYEFNTELSDDLNFLVVATLLCRSSTSRKGHMAAVLVSANNEIIARANNVPLLFHPVQKNAKEIHAEANLVAWCARNNVNTDKATCYVTAPPCTECFMSLAAAGISRIVHLNSQSSDPVRISAHVLGIEMVAIPPTAIEFSSISRDFWAANDETTESTRSRVDAWWATWMKMYKAAAVVLGITVREEPNDGGDKRYKKRKQDQGTASGETSNGNSMA